MFNFKEKEKFQNYLLMTILIMQVIYTTLAFKLDNLREKITVSGTAAIMQIILIIIGFFIAYHQIVFSRKLNERAKIWKKIHHLENEYLGIRIKTNFLLTRLSDDTRSNEKILIKKYLRAIIIPDAEFSVKLNQILDELFYDIPQIKIAYDAFLKNESEREKKEMEIFICFLTAKSKRNDLIGNKLKNDAVELAKTYKKHISSTKDIFESNNYKTFKLEVKKILS